MGLVGGGGCVLVPAVPVCPMVLVFVEFRPSNPILRSDVLVECMRNMYVVLRASASDRWEGIYISSSRLDLWEKQVCRSITRYRE